MSVKSSAAITLSCVVDVVATTRYYLLQSSTLSPPAKPSAKQPGGSWTDSEPSYTATSTNSLYFVDRTDYSDGTWAYSSVSLSSSYEAAKLAYNKATAAQDAAQKALSNVELIVGEQTAATAAWTGHANFDTLVDKQQISYWLPVASKASATLDRKSRVARPCCRRSCLFSYNQFDIGQRLLRGILRGGRFVVRQLRRFIG